jgi:cell division protein FtsL
MTNIKNEKTVLVTIAAIVAVIAVSTIAIGYECMALAQETTTITKNVTNKGVNTPIDSDQKQDCVTVGGTSGIMGSCHATSTDKNNETGGILKK